MKPTRRQVLQAAASASVAANAFAQAQSNPTMRLVVPYPPGGSSDRTARILAEALQPKLNQTIVVENVVGAGGRLAMRQLAAGPADAPVLVAVNPALMVVAPLVYKNNGYDPDKDFVPLSQNSVYEFALAVGPAVPVRELNHLFAWLRANPEKASFGVPATGSLPHFFSLMIGQAAKVPAQVAGYRGSAPLATDLIGGHVPLAVDTLDSLIAQHEGGKLRILATSGAKRAVPTIPTFKESGLNLVADGWGLICARPGMPQAQQERIAAAIADVMKQPETRKRFTDARTDPISATREQTLKMLADYRKQWVPVIQKAGLQFE